MKLRVEPLPSLRPSPPPKLIREPESPPGLFAYILVRLMRLYVLPGLACGCAPIRCGKFSVKAGGGTETTESASDWLDDITDRDKDGLPSCSWSPPLLTLKFEMLETVTLSSCCWLMEILSPSELFELFELPLLEESRLVLFFTSKACLGVVIPRIKSFFCARFCTLLGWVVFY